MMERRRALMGVSKSEDVIPDDYQEVTWIQCTYRGYNYVKTDVAIKDIQTVEFDGSVWKCSDSTASLVFYQAKDDELKLGFFSNYTYLHAFICSPVVLTSEDYTGHAVFTKRSGYGSETAPLYLFGGPTSSSARSRSIRCNKFMINGGKLFRGVPVYRKADSKIGLYDFVSRTFYPAVGSFTKGADVA